MRMVVADMKKLAMTSVEHLRKSSRMTGSLNDYGNNHWMKNNWMKGCIPLPSRDWRDDWVSIHLHRIRIVKSCHEYESVVDNGDDDRKSSHRQWETEGEGEESGRHIFSSSLGDGLMSS